MGEITYTGGHWRELLVDGEPSDSGRRVMTRQANLDGAYRVEIADGLNWRPLKANEHLKSLPAQLPQVSNDWVR